MKAAEILEIYTDKKLSIGLTINISAKQINPTCITNNSSPETVSNKTSALDWYGN